MGAERKYLAHYIDAKFDKTYAATEYVRLGKDLEEFSEDAEFWHLIIIAQA